MEFFARHFDPTNHKCDCLVVAIPAKKELAHSAQLVNEATGGFIDRVRQDGELDKFLSTVSNHAPAGLAAKRFLLVGLGDKPLTPGQLDKLAAHLVGTVSSGPVASMAICLEDLEVEGRDISRIARQLALKTEEALYIFDHYKSQKKPRPKLGKLTLHATTAAQAKTLSTALDLGRISALGVNYARELGDLPANHCTPSFLADKARELAKKSDKLTAKILGEPQMRTLGMHSLLSVTSGTETPAKLIVLEYKNGKRGQKPVALVGKGVTFDSGGISLKPGAGMDEMKFDMSGAASVLGAFAAAIELKLPLNLLGVIPAVENMPSGRATKPGDIITSMSGQTIEVLNTDAEGRLILCDALTYVERFKPSAVIDIATLTGACVIALGNHASGLFSNDDELAQALTECADITGDRVWRLPLWQEYDDQLKSNFADMANIGGRGAGSITAACFLARFAKKYPWAHLDIAGTAWHSGVKKGATGRPVALLIEYLIHRAG